MTVPYAADNFGGSAGTLVVGRQADVTGGAWIEDTSIAENASLVIDGNGGAVLTRPSSEAPRRTSNAAGSSTRSPGRSRGWSGGPGPTSLTAGRSSWAPG